MNIFTGLSYYPKSQTPVQTNFSMPEYAKTQYNSYQSNYHSYNSNICFVPASELSYNGSILGTANHQNQQIKIRNDLDPFTKGMVIIHEKLHLQNPGKSELQIRQMTVDECRSKGLVNETYAAVSALENWKQTSMFNYYG